MDKAVYDAAHKVADEALAPEQLHEYFYDITCELRLLDPVCEAIDPQYKTLDAEHRRDVDVQAFFSIGLAIGQRLGRGGVL